MIATFLASAFYRREVTQASKVISQAANEATNLIVGEKYESIFYLT